MIIVIRGRSFYTNEKGASIFFRMYLSSVLFLEVPKPLIRDLKWTSNAIYTL